MKQPIISGSHFKVDQICAWCKHSWSGIGGPYEGPPEVGDLTVCPGCQGVNIFTRRLRLRRFLSGDQILLTNEEAIDVELAIERSLLIKLNNYKLYRDSTNDRNN